MAIEVLDDLHLKSLVTHAGHGHLGPITPPKKTLPSLTPHYHTREHDKERVGYLFGQQQALGLWGAFVGSLVAGRRVVQSAMRMHLCV
jgi:hypothetical protein